LQEDEPFVREIYRLILQREVDAEALERNLRNLAIGTSSRCDIAAITADSIEARLKLSPIVALHFGRKKLVAQLPVARAILDLGGGGEQALSHLFHMGYPYVPEVHTIVDICATPKRRTNPDDEDSPLERWKAAVETYRVPMWDLAGLPGGFYDLAWAGESIEHVSEEQARILFKEVRRLLKQGARFCFDTPNRLVTSIHCPERLINPDHKVEYTPDRLRELLVEAGFRIEKTIGLCPMPKTVRSGRLDEEEMRLNSLFLEPENVDLCYIIYVEAVKK
jgi:SAM-dependent methyltransferase